MTDHIAMAEGGEFLAHFGVLGMHWGRHLPGRTETSHNGRNKHSHPDYTPNQQLRDKQIYGAGGVKRINTMLHEGKSISVARGAEVVRRNTVLNRNKYARKTGKITGAIVAPIAANVAISVLRSQKARLIGAKFISKVVGPTPQGRAVFDTIDAIGSLTNTVYGRIAITAGAAYLGDLLGGDIAVSINSRSSGYNPNRKK